MRSPFLGAVRVLNIRSPDLKFVRYPATLELTRRMGQTRNQERNRESAGQFPRRSGTAESVSHSLVADGVRKRPGRQRRDVFGVVGDEKGRYRCDRQLRFDEFPRAV